MKSIKYIIASALTVVLATGFSSCKDDDSYSLAEKLTNAQVYFPGQSNTKSVSLTPEEDSYTLEIVRRNATEAITVPLEYTGDDLDLFDLPSSVSFAANQTSAEIPVKVVADVDEFGYDTKHTYTVKIGNDSYTTPYGVDELKVTTEISAPWISLGTALYRDDFLTTFWNLDNLEYEVEVQENQMTPGVYRLIYPYDLKYGYNEEGDFDDTQSYNIEIHAEDPNRVYISVQEIGTDWGYGMISIGSIAGYYLANGEMTADEIEAEGYFGTLKDNVITFPAGTLLIGMADFKDGQLYGANYYGMFRVALPGAVLTDYSLEVAYAGKYTDAKDNVAGVLASITSAGDDVESIKLAVVPEDQADTAAAGIIDGSIASVTASPTDTNIQVPFSETPTDGKYVIVAVSYGGGEAQDVATTTFKYTADANAETWTKIAVGDYTYSLFFTDEDENGNAIDYVDAGLELYQSDKDSSRYKITNWGMGVDFIFTLDASTGVVVVEDDQETGYVMSSYGSIYVGDFTSYFGTTQNGTGEYEDGVFYFMVVYYCSQGFFTYGYETFELTDVASAGPAKIKAAKSAKAHKAKASKKGHKKAKKHVTLKKLNAKKTFKAPKSPAKLKK